MADNRKQQPPQAQGLRPRWEDMPETVRAQVEDWLGSKVAAAHAHLSGFSPGVAATLQTEDGRAVFVKAVGAELNPRTPDLHRREARVMQHLPISRFAPELLWFLDDAASGWVVLVFEHVQGHHPENLWRSDELQRVMQTVVAMSATLRADLLPEGVTIPRASTRFEKAVHGWQKLRDSDLVAQLDDWTTRHLSRLCELEQGAAESVAGDTLVHFDLRADNILLSNEKVWILDWAGLCTGADWLDVVLFAPSVGMQGGMGPEALIQRHPACQRADANAITAAVASLAGFFTLSALLPPSPGMDGLQALFEAQGVVARAWLRERTGWV